MKPGHERPSTLGDTACPSLTLVRPYLERIFQPSAWLPTSAFSRLRYQPTRGRAELRGASGHSPIPRGALLHRGGSFQGRVTSCLFFIQYLVSCIYIFDFLLNFVCECGHICLSDLLCIFILFYVPIINFYFFDSQVYARSQRGPSHHRQGQPEG